MVQNVMSVVFTLSSPRKYLLQIAQHVDGCLIKVLVQDDEVVAIQALIDLGQVIVNVALRAHCVPQRPPHIDEDRIVRLPKYSPRHPPEGM